MTSTFQVDSRKGDFVRSESGFRNWITADDNRVTESSNNFNSYTETAFIANSDRYHLYVSHACPWAHSTMIFRTLKA